MASRWSNINFMVFDLSKAPALVGERGKECTIWLPIFDERESAPPIFQFYLLKNNLLNLAILN